MKDRNFMESLFKAALPSLAKDLVYSVEQISSLDHFYTDGSSVGSFLKLNIHGNQSRATVYLFSSGNYITVSSLGEEEQRILDDWIASVKNKKIEHDTIQKRHHLKQ